MREPSTAMRISIVRITTRPPTMLVMLPRTPPRNPMMRPGSKPLQDCLRLFGAEAH